MTLGGDTNWYVFTKAQSFRATSTVANSVKVKAPFHKAQLYLTQQIRDFSK